MQAIQTKYLAPTNSRGSRFKATCWAGSITVPYDYSVNVEPNHLQAAMALCVKLGWVAPEYGRMAGGTLADGSMVWVFDDPMSLSFEPKDD